MWGVRPAGPRIASQPRSPVAVADTIAACGSSGNSTEPHLHFQVQDRARPIIAAGLPLAFTDLVDDGDPIELPPPDHAVTFRP